MESARLYRYYRPHGFGPRWLMYHFLIIDSKLKHMFKLGQNYGIITFLTWIMVCIIFVCSFASARATRVNEKDFLELHRKTEKNIPRKKSVTDIRPAYNCIHKHLQQTDVFQEKLKKMLCKEHLELEILNSRINCINKLLKPESAR